MRTSETNIFICALRVDYIRLFYVFFIVVAEILLNQYTLVEFEDEECTAVVPFHRIFCRDLEAVSHGDIVKVQAGIPG